MLDGLAAGILVVDFSLHLVKAALCLFVAGSERFVFLVVVCLVLCHMGVLVDTVLYQPRDDVQLIGQLRFLPFKSGGVKGRVPDKAEGRYDRILVGEYLVCCPDERSLYLVLGRMRRGAFLAAVFVVASPDDLSVLFSSVINADLLTV